MKITDKVKYDFSSRLLRWYEINKRDLPWRRTSDPYRIWISEVMLQQTRVETVLPYYHRFLQRFPDITALAEARLDAVLKVWEGLGYYSRARNLHKSAQSLVTNGKTELPAAYDDLLTIPGIGPYTAAAVASIAFGADHAVVDGNVARVLSRLLLIEEPLKQSAVKSRLQTAATTLLSAGNAGDFNQAMMELGATICLSRQPLCDRCPVAVLCRACLELDEPDVLPVRTAAREKPHYDIAAGLVWHNGRVFIDQRPPNGLLGGLWELPGGRQENGESLQACVMREITEKFCMHVDVLRAFATVKHAYSHFRITLHVFECEYRDGDPVESGRKWLWVKPDDLQNYAFPKSNKQVLDLLQEN